MIFNEARIKKFVEGVFTTLNLEAFEEWFITTDDITSICLNSEYLPHNHADIYLFISFMSNLGLLERVRKGKYLFDKVKGREYL